MNAFYVYILLKFKQKKKTNFGPRLQYLYVNGNGITVQYLRKEHKW